MYKNPGEVRIRVDGLDCLKFICAAFVVCIHVPFPGTFGRYISVLARVAVPVFFIISGYFHQDDRAQNIKFLKKVFLLTIKANLLYFLMQLFLAVLGFKEWGYIAGFFSIKALVKFVCFNASPFCYHLWYLNALLYTMVCVLLLDRWNLRKKSICIYTSPFIR